MARALRIRAFTRTEREARGYVGFKQVSIQQLQERRWWGWRTIDEEIVPSYAHIYLGAYGDTGGWVSKFYVYGSWGRDGKVTRHQEQGK